MWRALQKDCRVPEVCYMRFHLPTSLDVFCDCTHLCKWPPNGPTSDALPLRRDEFVEKEDECVPQNMLTSVKRPLVFGGEKKY